MDAELEKKKFAELREYTKAVAKDAAAFAIRLRALDDGGLCEDSINEMYNVLSTWRAYFGGLMEDREP